MTNYYFIEFQGAKDSWNKKFSCADTIVPEFGFTAYEGSRISKSEGSLLQSGSFKITLVTEEQFKKETRLIW